VKRLLAERKGRTILLLAEQESWLDDKSTEEWVKNKIK
jgi:hypothetical protein